MSAAMTRTAPAGRTLRFITALSARLTCPKPNARPIRHNGQVPDRNGKIFYTSIASLSHINKIDTGVSIIGLLRNYMDLRMLRYEVPYQGFLINNAVAFQLIAVISRQSRIDTRVIFFR